ncbi:hypothetical protein B0A50_01207 [Salinomyces thailandicus]|uniref:Uncharacterized protein n=1 Tax=Salinomyces thailandicus TaxID=706561 RepID=A0A4U0UB60_9PEZI|nr:hypothetical protein B0A50_01207 [Salinomyces thailandica]
MQPLPFLTLAASVPTLAVAALHNHFVSPPPLLASHFGNYSHNYAYALDDIITLEWQTYWTSVSATLQQDGNSSFQYLPNGRHIPRTQRLTWLVDVDGWFDPSTGNAFFVSVFNEGKNASAQEQFKSHYFNITTLPSLSNATLASTNATFYAPASSGSSGLSYPATKNATANFTKNGTNTPPLPTALATSQFSVSTASATSDGSATAIQPKIAGAPGAKGTKKGASIALVIAMVGMIFLGA